MDVGTGGHLRIGRRRGDGKQRIPLFAAVAREVVAGGNQPRLQPAAGRGMSKAAIALLVERFPKCFAIYEKT
jgi:hypothetical protein